MQCKINTQRIKMQGQSRLKTVAELELLLRGGSDGFSGDSGDHVFERALANSRAPRGAAGEKVSTLTEEEVLGGINIVGTQGLRIKAAGQPVQVNGIRERRTPSSKLTLRTLDVAVEAYGVRSC